MQRKKRKEEEETDRVREFNQASNNSGETYGVESKLMLFACVDDADL